MRGRKPNMKPTGNVIPMLRGPYTPKHLGKDATDEWRRVINDLLDRKILTNCDLGILESYCTAIGMARQAERILGVEGLIVQGARGPVKHPAVGILKDATNTARQLGSELGLTPASRSRPSVREDADEDDLLSGL